MRFIKGLKATNRLQLSLSPTADTTPFLESPWITEVQLTIESWNVDLSSFRHCSSLDVRCSDKQGTHRWAYDLPALTALEVMGGHHQFDALQAPRLEKVHLKRASAASLRGLSACRTLTARDLVLESLDGLGPLQDLRLWDCTFKSLSGLESVVITELDLTSGTYSGLAAVGRIATLQKLKFNAQIPSEAVRELPPCPQIRALEIPGYAGSLAFLSAWTALEELDLRNSGKLTDLDALAGLTALQKIRIRGAVIKKDSWPVALKDSLDTK